MEYMARTDGLTGAWTRGYGMHLLEAVKKKGILFTVAYIDLDGLKKVNDSRGHDAGDCYLKAFAEGIKSCLAKEDLLIRVGGDEFIAVFMNMGLKETNKKLKESRKAMEKGNPPVFFSFGMASGDRTIEELIKDADRTMYLEKKCRREER